LKIPAIVTLAATIAAAAQAAGAIEDLARIGEAEVASLEAQSVQARGELTRFDVRVSWRDPQARPPGAAAGRVVRYLARCGQKTMALSAVAILDDNGRMAKTHVAPPGGSTFAAPAEGSREAGWLASVCR
jgi:hypothetical protein